jgi:hypothetical protein
MVVVVVMMTMIMMMTMVMMTRRTLRTKTRSCMEPTDLKIIHIMLMMTMMMIMMMTMMMTMHLEDEDPVLHGVDGFENELGQLLQEHHAVLRRHQPVHTVDTAHEKVYPPVC